MTTRNSIETAREEPLTREDVERLLREVGDSHLLNLHRRNLRDIDLHSLKFSGANLSEADLRRANLSDADLSDADLSDADLTGAYLRRANLIGAYLIGAYLRRANLRRANLSDADLTGAYLSEANLIGANLIGANFSEAYLSGAYLRRADLRRADLRGADLTGADLTGADLTGAYLRRLTIDYSQRLMLLEALYLNILKDDETTRNFSEFHFHIHEEPLLLTHVTTILSALTNLAIKCWLLAQERYGEVVTYTQTHDVRIAEEASFVITDVSYGSFDANINFPNLDPKNLADALRTGLDTFLLAGERLKQTRLDTETKVAQLQQEQKRAELEYQAKQQELVNATQKAVHDEQLMQLEVEKQKFELERRHLLSQIDMERQKLDLERQQVAIQKEQVELENTRMTYAIEAANKMITMLAPSADQATRAMLIQNLLPDILQFHAVQNVTVTLLPSQEPEKPNRGSAT